MADARTGGSQARASSGVAPDGRDAVVYDRTTKILYYLLPVNDRERVSSFRFAMVSLAAASILLTIAAFAICYSMIQEGKAGGTVVAWNPDTGYVHAVPCWADVSRLLITFSSVSIFMICFSSFVVWWSYRRERELKQITLMSRSFVVAYQFPEDKPWLLSDHKECKEDVFQDLKTSLLMELGEIPTATATEEGGFVGDPIVCDPAPRADEPGACDPYPEPRDYPGPDPRLTDPPIIFL